MKRNSVEVLKYSNDLVKLDEILVGGLLCVVASKTKNANGHYVLRCGIVGSKYKKRNQLTLIIPDKTPVITYR